MKKVISILLLFCFIMCLVACGGKNTDQQLGHDPKDDSDGVDNGSVQNNQSKGTYHIGETINREEYSVSADCADVVTTIGNYVPGDDELFFLMGITVENKLSSILTFKTSEYKVYVDGNQCTLTSLSSGVYYDYEDMWSSKEIGGSKKAKILVAADVPQEFETIEVFFGDDSFVIQKEDLGDLTPDLSALGKEYGVGETFRAVGFDITVSKVLQTDYISAGSYSYYDPDPGKHFVLIFLEAMNVSKDALELNYFQFSPYVDDYAERFTSIASYVEVEGVREIDRYTEVQAGKKTSGFILLQVKDGWKTIELISRESTLVINSDDVVIE